MTTISRSDSPRDCWRTPKPIFDGAQRAARCVLEIDLAADRTNHLCRAYSAEGTDSLLMSWDRITAWCNPPYSKIGPWVDKAACAKGSVIAMLLPASVDTHWFYTAITHAARWYLYRGRIHFLPPPGVKSSTPRINNALFVFDSTEYAFDVDQVMGSTKEGFSGHLDSKTGLPVEGQET